MLTLALDTATPAVTVALHDGTATLAASTVLGARRHGELLAPGVSAILARAGAAPGELARIAVGVGPGPYTGLRVGLVTARTFGFALGVPVYGVCTLDVLAHECRLGESPAGAFLVATDARRGEVYWARYAESGCRDGDPAVAKPDEIDAGELPTVGEGAVLYPQAFPGGRPPTYPSASFLARLVTERLAAGEPLPDPEPMYLRRPHATIPGPGKQVSPA